MTATKNEPKFFKYTNTKESPYLDVMLAMFYSGALQNKIGIMEARDKFTGENALLLVGIEQDENGEVIGCHPIAKCLSSEDISDYLEPDGQGGWLNSADALSN